MSHRLSGVLCAVLVLFSFNVRAVTIDFQSLANENDQEIGTTYSEDGFTISALMVGPTQTFLYSFGTSSNSYRGSTALRNGTDSTDVPVTRLAAGDGSPFNLASIMLAEGDGTAPGPATIDFTGYLDGGGTVTRSFTLDGIFSTGSGFELLVFSGFENLTHVEWDNMDPFHQFDDIVVETVPIPAAAWLFGSGLLVMLGLARKRRAS